MSYTPEEALAMHWETIRVFPPVVVFPYWDPRPTCFGLSAEETAKLSAPHGQTAPCPLGEEDPNTGYPRVNQYSGGRRWLPNVAMAQLDPDIWGEDSLKFRKRPLELYENYSVGFAEPAVDYSTAKGGMNRACPGKRLALLMGSTFLRHFNKAEWFTDPNVPIKIKTGGKYVQDFTIYHRSEKAN